MKCKQVKDITRRTLAIIPAYNEEDSVGKVVDGVRAQGFEVLVVDDRSSDQTRIKALKSGALVLSLITRLGAWGAIQAGFRYALGNGYRYGLTLDADGQHLPESISCLLTSSNVKNYDVIIGSCPERVSRLRKVAWAWFRNISCTDYNDLTSGLRVYNRWSMRLMLSRHAYLFDYQDMGALLLLQKHGLRIKEVPVKMASRKSGHSRVFNNWFKVCNYMAVTTSLSASKFRQRRRSKDKNI